MYDDSERKPGAEELQAHEAHYRRLIKNIPEVVWTADEQGNALFISEKIENVFGYSSEEVLQQGAALWFGRMHPDDRGHVQNAYAALFNAGRPYDVEYRIQHRDGRWMWWRDRAAITEQAQEKRYADGLLSDVTEQKNLEMQLRQAQKMEAVGQLAGGIAHDFNNLLCVLQGHTELAKEQVGHNPDLLRHMEVIAESAKRATSLIQQLLAFSRKQVLRATVIDLNVTVACVQKFLSRVIGENIELIARFQVSPASIKADPVQLEQVLMNLALNARDAMPEGGRLVIETSSAILDENHARQFEGVIPGSYILLSVADTGRGMEPEMLDHIFDPFFTTKPRGQGTGLGLATVYGIVKQSNGHIAVESEPGWGTTFRVYLPAQNIAPEHSDEQARTDLPRGNETILVAEDQPQLRDLTRIWLEGLGYSVLTAASAREAISMAESTGGKIHLLLTDLIMPGANGRKLAEKISSQHPAIKVVFMTGYTDDIVIHHKLLQPGTHLLRKPFNRADLARTLRAAIDEVI